MLSPATIVWAQLSKHDANAFRTDDQYGRLATVTGAKWSKQGYIFDGVNNIINIANGVEQAAAAVTIIVWLNLITVPASTRKTIVCINNYPTAGYDFCVDGASTPKGAVRFIYKPSGSAVDKQTVRTLTAGNWYHVAIAMNASRQKIVINGEEASLATAANPGTITYSGTPTLDIGKGPTGAVNAIIGEVIVANRAVMVAQIQKHYLDTKYRYS